MTLRPFEHPLEAAAPAPRKRAPVIDLMQALQKSLGELPATKKATKRLVANG